MFLCCVSGFILGVLLCSLCFLLVLVLFFSKYCLLGLIWYYFYDGKEGCCVFLVRKKRFRGTFLTEEEFRVLSVLLSCGRVSDAARVLGRAQPTISIVKKRIEEKLNMA